MLEELGVDENDYVGAGSEAAVYVLYAHRVARVHGRGVVRADVHARTSLLAEFAPNAGAVPFAIPKVLDVTTAGGRLVTIEARLPGRPVLEILGDARAVDRPALIRSYLAAVGQIGDLGLQLPWYGEIVTRDPIRTSIFGDFLRERARTSLRDAGPDFSSVDPEQIAADLPEPTTPCLVHLDAFPGNVLAEGTEVTAVIDFGPSCIMGDRRLDVLSAVAYLDSRITPSATSADRRVGTDWLQEQGLLDLYEPARRWLGAYWSFARSDARLAAWCTGILRPMPDTSQALAMNRTV